MGCDTGCSADEKPSHEVIIPSFEMLQTEVADRGNHPINCLSWNLASDFRRFVGGRLPTEAEWEYAARSGGKIREFPRPSRRAAPSSGTRDPG